MIFDKETITKLEKYQNSRFHAYTCPNDGDVIHIEYEFKKKKSEKNFLQFLEDERIKGIPFLEMEFKQTKLIPTETGFICPVCDYIQTWCHELKNK